MHPRIFVYDCIFMLFLGMCLGENMFVCVYVWCVSFVSVCLGGCFVGVYIYTVYMCAISSIASGSFMHKRPLWRRQNRDPTSLDPNLTCKKYNMAKHR